MKAPRQPKFVLWTLITALSVTAAARAGEEGPKPVFIKAGKMWDGDKGDFVLQRTIRVAGSRIAAVGEKLEIPEGSRTIDLTGLTVLPGLIDAHTHLLYLESIGEEPGNLSMEGLKALLMEGDALRALRGAARAKTFLEAGITAVQDLGNSGRFADVALRTAIQEGSAVGPRMRVSGPGLSPVGGQWRGLLQEYHGLPDGEYRIVRGVEDGIQAVRENVNMGVDLIKVYSDSSPSRSRLSVEEMTAIVREAHRYGLRVTAHAVREASIRDAVLAGVDGVDHVYSVTDETLKLIKDKGTTVIPTYIDRESFLDFYRGWEGMTPEKVEDAWKAAAKQFTDLIGKFMKLGIPVASGSDMYIDMKRPQGQAAKRVLYAYAECGMSVREILRTTSTNAARHLGMENRIGVIKPQAYADVVAVDGDPEKDVHCLDKIVFVMKDGVVYVDRR